MLFSCFRNFSVCSIPCTLLFHSVYYRHTLPSSCSLSCHSAGSAFSLPQLTVFLQSHYEEERHFTSVPDELDSIFAFSHHPCLPFPAVCLHLGYLSRPLSRKKKPWEHCTVSILMKLVSILTQASVYIIRCTNSIKNRWRCACRN